MSAASGTRDGGHCGTAERRRAMAACAAATSAELDGVLAAIHDLPPVRDLRAPEVGMVMVRGRMGGDGAAFNLGEATVTRAAVALEGGAVGHAWQLGRDPVRARQAAIVDALMQTPGQGTAVIAALSPVEARIAADRARAARRAAATRVDFFTMTRGED